MNSERWSLIQSIFETALEKEPSERITFLKAACQEDVDLYREVSSLLESDQQINSLLDGQAFDAVSFARHQADEMAEADERIGPYRIIKRIGSGGMGIVYLADRADGQFEQKVALKLIKKGMDSEQIVRRFLAERQILARLNHPNIARLLDGGISDDGRPYFAMEYVEGTPLINYCNAKKHSIKDRLLLFGSVCDAVQYAHRNLIVHRDLKPGNILVMDDGQIKLLDFGIARVLEDRDAPPQTLLTEAGMRVLTPEYAAPEQVNGGTITTQTDVYALGVVLYELLTGDRPLKLSSHKPAEVEAVVCHQEPQKPSTRVLENKTVAETHQFSAEKIQRQLKGDLDTICLKSLRKEPERRYGTVDELWLDIDRHLKGLPVIAQADSVTYRLKKFISRHRNGALITMIATVLLAGVISIYTIRLGQERDRAQTEAEKAAQTAQFLTSLFDGANPHVAQGDTLNARHMLDAGAQRIEEELADQPGVQASLLTTIGDAYNGLGLYRQAGDNFEKALALKRQIGEGDTEAAATLLQTLADIHHSLSNFPKADSFQQATLAAQKKLFGDEHPAIAATLLKMASTNRSLGKFDVALPLYHEAVAMNEKLLPKDDPELGWSINNLGWAYHSQGHYEEAETAYRKAETLQREYLGEDHPDLAFTLSNLGGLLWTTGRFDEGEPLVRESLAIRRALYGEEHPETMQSLNNLAGLLFRKDDFEAAEPLYLKTLEINRRMLGEKHRYVATGLSSLGAIHQKKGELEEAEALQKQALKMRMEIFGASHRQVATSQTSLASVYRAQGRLREAEELYRTSLDFWRSQGTEPVEMAYPLVGLGRILTENGSYSEAEAVLNEALALRTSHFEENDLLVTEVKAALGRCYALDGRQEATALLQEALDAYEQAGKSDGNSAVEIRGWLNGLDG